MQYAKWIRTLFIIVFFFFITPNSTATDTSSVLQATHYATSVSNFSLYNFTLVDRYLGGSFKVSIWDDIKHGFDDIGNAIKDAAEAAANAIKQAAEAVASAVTTAISAVKSAVTVAADATGDALKKAGEVTGDFIKTHGVLIGTIAGAIILTVVTDGLLGPAAAEIIADDAAAAAITVGGEAAAEASEAVSETTAEASAEVGTEQTTEAGTEQAANGDSAAADSSDNINTIEDDVEADAQINKDAAGVLTTRTNRVYTWYAREVAVEGVIKAIKDRNMKEILNSLFTLQQKASGMATDAAAQSYLAQVAHISQLIGNQTVADITSPNPALLLPKLESLQQTISTQLQEASAQLPPGTNPKNIIGAYSLIDASKLSSAQQQTLQQWAAQNNTASDVTLLAGALQFTSFYNAAQGGTSAQQAAYQQFIAKLPATALGLLMSFAADNSLVTDSTTLSDQAFFLTNPYQYYLSEQIQAEQNNLNAQKKQTNLSTTVTVTNSSNYAITQMIAMLNGLTPAQRQSVMNIFYGNAAAVGDTASVTVMQQYITPDGVIITSSITTSQTETVQTVINNAQANITTASNSLTTAQSLQNGYTYSSYYNNISSNLGSLLQVAASLPVSSPPATTESVQAQITSSGLSTQAQTNLTTYLTQNGSQTGAANAVSAAIQYAQLFNAAYGTSTPTASAQQAFASYSNKLDPDTTTTMMKFAVEQGLVSQQNSLLIADPAQWMQNEMNVANQNNHTLSDVLGGFGELGQINSLENLPIQYTINSQQYAMAQLYNATKDWSQAQLQTLASRIYYGSIMNGSGLSSTIQNYLTPAGTYQNNPQGIMAAQHQAAVTASLSTPEITPAAMTQALEKMTPAAANKWIESYQVTQQTQQSEGMMSFGTPVNYNSAISQYQANQQAKIKYNGTPAQQETERLKQQMAQQMQQQELQAMGGNGLGGAQAMGGTLSY